jgi:hypothetical protein
MIALVGVGIVLLNSISLNEVSMLNIFGMPEKRLEETFEADLDNAVEDRYGKKDDAPEEGYVGVPGKKTKETVLLLMQLLTHLTLPRKKKNVLMNRRYYECISKH